MSQPTLSSWRKLYGKLGGMKEERSTTKLSLEEQHKVVLDYQSLPISENGVYLRQYGLKSSELARIIHEPAHP